jgi:hypothetical protein
VEAKYQALYVQEIKTQAELALGAFQIAGRIVNEPEYKDIGVSRIFRELHSFLTHASNVSKLFWPEVSKDVPGNAQKRERRQRIIDRGEHLKPLFDMQPDNALFKRELRNNLEHFDERLDDFIHDIITTNPDVNIVDMCVSTSRFAQDDVFTLRLLIRQNAKFIFRNEEYDLVAIADALLGVLRKAEGLKAQGLRIY